MIAFLLLFFLNNGRYLSSKQALFDLANFVVNFTDSLAPATENLKLDLPYQIISIGGSYSGALSGTFSTPIALLCFYYLPFTPFPRLPSVILFLLIIYLQRGSGSNTLKSPPVLWLPRV